MQHPEHALLTERLKVQREQYATLIYELTQALGQTIRPERRDRLEYELRRAQAQLAQIHAGYDLLELGHFGWCWGCGQAIDARTLFEHLESKRCNRCAGRTEPGQEGPNHGNPV